jgi:hypothetical protein
MTGFEVFATDVCLDDDATGVCGPGLGIFGGDVIGKRRGGIDIVDFLNRWGTFYTFDLTHVAVLNVSHEFELYDPVQCGL